MREQERKRKSVGERRRMNGKVKSKGEREGWMDERK